MKILRLLISFILMTLLTHFTYAQHAVTGRVVDEADMPLVGANVVIAGGGTGTITDIDGNFEIQVPSTETELQFSYVGYLSETIKVGTQTNIEMRLLPDLKAFDEVVVIGYGSTRKKDLTSAIATVSSEEIAKMPVTSFAQALQGKAAGVTVVQSGKPGEEAKIRIRGTSSVNGADPLYVVDGIIDADPPSPANIETIQILKDAASAAIYGSRGTNGVIIITTKKGKKGEPNITFKNLFMAHSK
ncbi:MAG: TonB-dependent receptor plug domain-containing protein [Bacteroidales bacterium]|nr:TonB-dependent receptor plug domain-containing protein [Bacteroidales bacterium]